MVLTVVFAFKSVLVVLAAVAVANHARRRSGRPLLGAALAGAVRARLSGTAASLAAHRRAA